MITISIYLANQLTKTIDALGDAKETLPQTASHITLKPNTFKKASFDVDFLTIPFKYRPRQNEFPRQFNTDLNGAIYAGYRNEYISTPL